MKANLKLVGVLGPGPPRKPTLAEIAEAAWAKANETAVLKALPFDHMGPEAQNHMIEFARHVIAAAGKEQSS